MSSRGNECGGRAPPADEGPVLRAEEHCGPVLADVALGDLPTLAQLHAVVLGCQLVRLVHTAQQAIGWPL
jgi:hypothetical protein